MNNQDNAGYRRPSPDDDFIDYDTFLMMYRSALASGDIELSTTNITAADQPIQKFAIIEALTEQSGEAGTIPGDTSVVMYQAVEAKWDSSQNAYVAATGGMKFDGIDQNFLRLVGQPGFSDTPYNYNPLSIGALVPIYRVPENAVYSSPGDIAANIKLFGWSWQIVYLGEDPVVHPFKASLGSNKKTIVVGYMRDFVVNAGDGSDVAASSHTGADIITIMDGASPIIIELATEDTLEIEGVQGTDSIIYYIIDMNSSAPTATLMESEDKEWPPSEPSDMSKQILIPVCYVRIIGPELPAPADPAIGSIGQLLFSHVTFVQGTDSTSSTQVTRSITKDSKLPEEGDQFKIQLVNDFDLGDLGALHGDVSMLYGGIETLPFDTTDVFQRSYFPNWDENQPTNSYLNPMSGGGTAREDLNEREIRIKSLGMETEIRHAVLPDDKLDAETYKTFWAYDNDPTIAGVIEHIITKTRHVHPKGDSGYPDDPYESEKVLGVNMGSPPTVPEDGSLFDAEMAVTSTVTDQFGAPTSDFDGPANLEYTGVVAGVRNLELSDLFNQPWGQVEFVEISELGGGPSHGNIQTFRYNLSRELDGSNLKIKAAVILEPFPSDFANITMHSVEITHELLTSPLPQSTNFILRVALVDALAARFDQFDGLGEYDLITTCTYQSDGAEAAPQQSIVVNDINANTESGADFIYNITPDAAHDTSIERVCFTTELHFVANIDALAGQFGICQVTNLGNDIETCEAWDSPTNALSQVPEWGNPEIGNPNQIDLGDDETVLLGGINYAKFAQSLFFQIRYLNGGADTAIFSTGMSKGSIRMERQSSGGFSGIRFGQSAAVGPIAQQGFELSYDIDAAAGGFTTDHLTSADLGFDLIEESEFVDGSTYRFVLNAPGCAEVFLPFILTSNPALSQEYTECGTSVTIYIDPTLSLSAATIEVEGVCYELTEESSQTAIDVFAIGISYSDCPSCEAAQGSEKWVSC